MTWTWGGNQAVTNLWNGTESRQRPGRENRHERRLQRRDRRRGQHVVRVPGQLPGNQRDAHAHLHGELTAAGGPVGAPPAGPPGRGAVPTRGRGDGARALPCSRGPGRGRQRIRLLIHRGVPAAGGGTLNASPSTPWLPGPGRRRSRRGPRARRSARPLPAPPAAAARRPVHRAPRALGAAVRRAAGHLLLQGPDPAAVAARRIGTAIAGVIFFGDNISTEAQLAGAISQLRAGAGGRARSTSRCC